MENLVKIFSVVKKSAKPYIIAFKSLNKFYFYSNLYNNERPCPQLAITGVHKDSTALDTDQQFM